MNDTIYLDNNSTTMIDPRVLDAMLPYMKEEFGNASSTEHIYGWNAEDAVNKSREQIANLIDAHPSEIFFTSGATESNNLALVGATISNKGHSQHIITVSTEHKAVLDVCKALEEQGINVTYLSVKRDGLIDLRELEDEIREDTVAVSVMHANNEIGVIQPIDKISDICSKHDVMLHIDAAQSVGKIKLSLKGKHISLISISAHKIYGPKGVGALYVNLPNKKNIRPILFGGGHEKGLRAGTLAVHNIVGMGMAAEICLEKIENEANRIAALRKKLLSIICNALPETVINGSMKNRLPGNLNLSFPNIYSEPLIPNLKKIAISSGSACTSSSPEPSHVLRAIGLSNMLIKNTVRIGIGRFNTEEDINEAGEHIVEVVKRISEKNRMHII